MRGDLAGQAGGRAAQRDDDLPGDVEPGIFVDAEPGLDDAVADEHQPGVDRPLLLGQARPQPDIDIVEQARLAADDEADLRRPGVR